MCRYQIRLALDSDSRALRALIRRIFADYPNCVLDVEHEERDLLAIRSAFERKFGTIWVVEAEGEVVGCGGVVRGKDDALAEVRKLYVQQEHRRMGIARRLCDRIIEQARAWDRSRLVAWSDSRFREAHRFYESLGFVRLSGSRELFDLSQTVEYPFELSLESAGCTGVTKCGQRE